MALKLRHLVLSSGLFGQLRHAGGACAHPTAGVGEHAVAHAQQHEVELCQEGGRHEELVGKDTVQLVPKRSDRELENYK